MSLPVWALFAAAFALVLAHVIRAQAIRRGLLDKPNERSLHTVPVPRIGGVAIVGAVLFGLVVAPLVGSEGGEVHFASGWFGLSRRAVWCVLSVPVFLLGLIDDVRPLSTKVRFLAHVGVAAAFVLLLDPAAPLATELGTLHLHPWLFRILSGVWIVAVLNIYNFMDGMDGLAGGQTLAAGVALAVTYAVRAPDLALPFGLMAGAAFGFLAHNYPPARIFMGDGCSTFLGFAFATLPLVAHARGASSFLLAPTVLAPFLGDGTFTILRRALAREKFWQAHRTHLYQRAVASGLEHRDVLLVYLVWLAFAAAVAIVCHRQPPGMGARPLLAFALAYAPLLAVYLWVRAREQHKVPGAPSAR